MSDVSSAKTKLSPAARAPIATILETVGGIALIDLLSTRKVAMNQGGFEEFMNEKITLPEIPENSYFDPTLVVPGEYVDFLSMPLKDPAGELIVHLIIPGDTTVNAPVVDAANDVLNQIASDPNGKVAVDDLPDLVRNLTPTEDQENQYNEGEDYNRAAVARVQPAVRPKLADKIATAIRKARGNQDASRVSKEYHEWKYCCVDSNNYTLMSESPDFPFDYTGSDGLSTSEGVTPASSNVPPYYVWIKLDTLRECVKYCRRHRRLRSRCGGKALWTSQGHASKNAAIQNDLYLDAEFGTELSDVLIATSEFEWRA